MKKNEIEQLTKGSDAMKIQVLHDDQGNILSFSIVESGVKDGLSLLPKKNQSTTVVNMPVVKGETTSSEEDFKRLFERIRQHKVDITSKEGKLVRKPA